MPHRYGESVWSSENPSGADNQQERPGLEQWVVGFTDGEGCFSISVVKNSGLRLGWQVQHEFSITQLRSSSDALELAGSIIGVGTIIENRRHDDHRESLMRLSVKRRSDLINAVIPFFERNPLRTEKRYDFMRFRSIIAMMEQQLHLELDGLVRIAQITEHMNRRQRSRFLESSEAIRQPSDVRRVR